MKAFGFYKSRKYFQRVLISIMLAMAFILAGLSVANAYVLERSVKQAQEDSNLKVLTQIQYNLSYMNEIITHLSTFAFRDNYLIPLMFSEPLPAMDYIRGYNEMEKLMESSSFLQSMAVYNARDGEIYGSSSDFLVDGGVTKQRMLDWLLRSPQPLPTSRLIPVSLKRENGGIDAFAFIVADAFKPFEGTESAVILYVKSDWVFDSLRRMNGAGSGIEGEIYIRTPDGRLYADGRTEEPGGIDEAKAAGLIDPQRPSGFAVGDVGGGKSMVTYMNGIGDWTILYVQPYARLMKEVTKTREKSMLVSGAFLLLAAGVSVWLSYKLYSPIDAMLRRIRPHLPGEDRAEAAAGNELERMGDNVLRLSEKLHEIGSEQIVRKYYLRKFLSDSGWFADADMLQLIGRHGLNMSATAPLTVCVLRIDRFGSYERTATSGLMKLHRFAFVNIAEELLSARFQCEAVDMRADGVVLIVSDADTTEGSGELRRRIRDIQDTIERFYGLSLSCGVSDAVPRPAMLTSAYRQAVQLCQYMFSQGYKSIIASGDIEARLSGARRTLPEGIERRLSEALKKGQPTNAGSELEKAFSLLAAFPYEDMRRSVSDLAWAIRNTAMEIRDNRLFSLAADPETLHKLIEDNLTLEEMCLLFQSVCANICEGQRAAAPDRSEWIVGTVKELIERQFADPNLSQQSIAATVKLTSAYVGKLFKDECGMTVTEYLNEVRLEQARKLLLMTDKTIAEIMDRCGYSNQSHFFRLFKGKFGSTPKEYRLKKSLG
ncbi:helix-turn-helix domain-containing protein [Cohnella zeiphila]|uniref:Helix-turn-helix domain-containing protein n=1 Tax=Cohnella zeiphila TaxID=2761120 RepID=A0A7X0SN38_9BACL|nr:helix-turn-helix domain-containing protein [Cohnella zeiphila]MBB6732961.1 helix-turn-helix domain-containing protein [Cohnella zeiphila]